MSKRTFNLHLKGYVGGYDFDSDYVDYVLAKNKDKRVDVLIDSLGGSVATALSISSAFRNHDNVYVHFVGMNASAATIASMGAKHISMDVSAMYLVHKCSLFFFEFGSKNADQLRERIEKLEKEKADLEKIDLNIASMYAARCKKTKAELLELMKRGGWLSANEAKDWGFVDEITDAPEDSAPVIDEKTREAMAAAGMPMPPFADGKKKHNVLTRCIEMLQGLFQTDTTTNIINSMKKTFKSVCAIIGMESVDCTDGKITLTEAQIQKVETRLTELETENAKLKDDLSDRDTQIEALKKGAGASTTQVINNQTGGKDDDEKSPYDELFEAARAANEIFNQLP